ncbi:MAG TPA: LysR substrate-binding domain-containing protein, partial [Opitutus sp.]|nr:LysR substrate-binding domain-containing protein [Opitutus sp.]
MSTRWVARIGCALALVAGGRLGGGEVRVAASDLLDAEFAAAAQDFARESELKLTLVLDGSRDAEARLRDDRADIGLIMLRLGQPAPGDGFRSFPLGYQVVCVLVAAASPLTQVTVPDVAGIYGAAAGASHVRWGELGLTGDWAVRTIEPLALAVGAGLSHELFRELVLAGGDFKSVVALQPSVDELTRKLAASQAGIALAGALAPDQARGLKLLP